MSNRGNMPVPPRWSGQDRRFGETVKNNLDVLCGYAGSPLDRAITARDLLDSGIATVAEGSNIFSGESTGLAPVTNDPTYDTPPAPTNFTVSGAYQNILLTWTVPSYNGHSYTEVYRHTADSIANATLVGQSSSFVGLFTDAVGGGQTYYYWIRVVNQNGVAGPFNSSTGTLGQTAVDVTHILSVLSDAITEDQLATALQGEIDKISGDINVTGSVAARIASEATARGQAITAEATARTTAVSGEASARAAAVTAEAQARSSAISTATDSLQSQLNDLTGIAAWDSSTSYAIGDNVRHDDKLWAAAVANSNSEPTYSGSSSTNSNWTLTGDYTSLASVTSANSAAITAINNVSTTSNSAAAVAIKNLQSGKEDTGVAAQAITALTTTIGETYATAANVTALETAVFNDMTGVADWVGADSSATPPITAVTYATGDRVIHNKKLYRATDASTDQEPPNTSYWALDTLSYSSAVSDLSTTLTQDYATSSATNLLLAQKENSGAAATALDDAKTYADENFASSTDLSLVETAIFNTMTGVADWNTSTTYAVGDRVIFGRKLYRATAASTDQQPPNASYWEVDTISSSSALNQLSTTLTEDYATASATNLLLADKEDSGVAAGLITTSEATAAETYATVSSVSNLESATFGNLTGLSAYDENTTYAIGDRVTHGTGANKKIYIATAASSSSNKQAPTVTSYWSEDTLASVAVTNAALAGKEVSGAAASALQSANTYTDTNAASASDFTALDTAVFNDVVGVNAWSSATSYVTGDRIFYSRKIYKAIANNSNVQPDTDSSKWVLDPVAASSALTALDTKVTEDYATSQSVTQGLALKINSTQSATNISQAIDVSEQTASETYATASNLSTLESSIFNNVINAPDWSESTAYAVGAYVTFEQKVYKSLLVNTNVEPDTDAAKWQVDTLTTADQVAETYATNTDVTVLRSNMFNNMTGVADWNASTSYVAGNRVVHTEASGVAKLYKCLIANTNTTPHDNISGANPKWELDTIASALALSSLETTVTDDYSTTVTVNGQLAGKESAGTAAGLLTSYTTTANQNTATATAVDAAYAAIFDEMTGLPTWNNVSVYEIGDRVVHRSSDTDNRKVYKALIAGSNAAPHSNLTGSTPKWELDTLAFAGALSTLDAQVNTNGTGLVSKVDGIELRIDDIGGVTMEQKFTAQATDIGDLESQYTVKIDANGAVAGFGLANTTTTAGNSTSSFYVNADRFAILPNQASSVAPDWAGGVTYASGDQVIHSGSIYISKFAHVSSSSSPPPNNFWTNGTAVPFVVQQTAQTINGTYVPVGVYMDTAYIKAADITSAQIGSVNADTITTGTLDVTNRINADAINATKLNLNGSSLTSVDVDGVPTLQIDDAAITTAKINDLAVETIKIKDQAVTIPSHAFVVGPKLVGTTEVTLCEETYVSSGAPALIMFTCGTEAYGYNCDRYFAAKLYKNGVYVRSFSGGKVKSNSNVSFNSVNFVYQETDTNAGSTTKYTVKGFGSTWGSGSAIFNDNSLFILETKK